jgi:hypothetical protein
VILADSHRVTAEPFFDAAVGWERERLRSTSEPLVTVHRLTRRRDPERP